MPDRSWWSALFGDPAAILASIGVKGDDIVDLCSGDGYFTGALARVGRRVYAIDLDPRLIDQALTEVGGTSTHYIVGDAYDIATLIPERADVVFLANAFHGVPDQGRLAREVQTALKPGGRFIILNWHDVPRERTVVLGEARGPATVLRMSPLACRQIVVPAGFEPSDTIEVPPYHYALNFTRI